MEFELDTLRRKLEEYSRDSHGSSKSCGNIQEVESSTEPASHCKPDEVKTHCKEKITPPYTAQVLAEGETYEEFFIKHFDQYRKECNVLNTGHDLNLDFDEGTSQTLSKNKTKPLLREPAKPCLKNRTKPLLREPAKPCLKNRTKPLLREPAKPCLKIGGVQNQTTTEGTSQTLSKKQNQTTTEGTSQTLSKKQNQTTTEGTSQTLSKKQNQTTTEGASQTLS
ncbi:hypothetical protein J6590_080105 [Homalodisca vitripennis]|nr:hypothetical protein J6590_080105 [Homalodisca vitripennis]